MLLQQDENQRRLAKIRFSRDVKGVLWSLCQLVSCCAAGRQSAVVTRHET